MNSKHIQATLGRAVMHYAPDDVNGLTDTDFNSDQLDAPYFSITLSGKPTRSTNDPRDPRVFMHVQLLAVTQGGTSDMNPNAKFDCADLASYLQTCLFFDQNLHDLRVNGIIPSGYVNAIPVSPLYLGNFTQFQAGADITLVVWDVDARRDPSRPGSIQSVKTNFKQKFIRKDDK